MDATIDTPAGRTGRWALLGLWAILAGYLIWHHVFWRDEVRAFSLALQGSNWIEMLRGVQGEGHPALWYILLRAAHDVIPVREVLPAMAAIIGFLAAALFALRAPFPLWKIALVLFGVFCLFEYTVSARNYGISMLVMFGIAWAYPKHRDSGILIGVLLAVLCNTNVHSALLAAAFLLFWLIELLSEDGLRWTPRLGRFALAAGIATLGAALCAVTVYPPANEAAVNTYDNGISLFSIAHAFLIPGRFFSELTPMYLGHTGLQGTLLTLALLGSPLGLIRRPAAVLAAYAALVTFVLLFYLVYASSYRHQALYLVFLITLYWLIAKGRGGTWPARWPALRPEALTLPTRLGHALFVVLLALQIPASVSYLIATANGIPTSRSRDLARLLGARHLTRAILIADPDVMIEPMPYYTTNPIYLMRQSRFGHVVPFTNHARLTITLGDMLDKMRALRAAHHRPVVAVLQHRFNYGAPARYFEGYLWSYTTTPQQIRTFESATVKLASFDESVSDERYDVYVLR